jgi:spore coat polysaccharide biosynthesis protein SpsF (cytidylyltransferase family)
VDTEIVAAASDWRRQPKTEECKCALSVRTILGDDAKVVTRFLNIVEAIGKSIIRVVQRGRSGNLPVLVNFRAEKLKFAEMFQVL